MWTQRLNNNKETWYRINENKCEYLLQSNLRNIVPDYIKIQIRSKTVAVNKTKIRAEKI